MELRDIEIFLTLAEEPHFSRTAARLRLSPARVTQAIQKQERQVGAPLFERTNRTVRLTPVGRQLRDDLRPLHAALKDSMERARLAAQGITGTLRVGMLPVKEPDLPVGPVLFAEPRVVAVAADHELTRRGSVSLEMLADFQQAGPPEWPDYWADGYMPSHTRSGRRIERGPLVRNTEEVLALAGNGEIVNLFPAHMRRYWSRPDIAYLSVRDIDALVWRTGAENEAVRALAAVIRDLGPFAPDG
ncbi:LysR family transcriptional regulator [Nonomuraea sp. WAC 01424]|uniref:LysR family transcriptional regulator n=1 Tax=Nonomuraea sp. WAC 01424 TaxID=2203200 RepID=UPI000F7AA0BE|nr:LysR family transcriptional regulator [Nonomuraea sp. WAC 01424]RSM95275.1 LysR family transcriptional regulator [Nonomuraea sp. WAC 01424]